MHVIVVEGIAKLLCHQRIYAPKLLSRLIVLWYNPCSKDNLKMMHCIGTFLPIFAFESRYHSALNACLFSFI